MISYPIAEMGVSLLDVYHIMDRDVFVAGFGNLLTTRTR